MIEFLLLLETDEDRLEFEKMYEQTHLKLLYTAMGILHDQYDAEEVVHDVYAKIAQEYSRYRGKSLDDMMGLGIVMTRNACINRMHAKRRHGEVSLESKEFYLGSEPDMLEDVLKQENIEALRSAMKKLKQKERDLLILKYYHDLSYKEIADIMNIREKSVDMRLYRVKMKLRELMEKDMGV